MIGIGPQGEPLEWRDVAVDGPAKAADSSVANGTDRDIVNTEKAIIGPQGEKLFPVNDSGICPVCGSQWGEAASLPQPGEEPSAFGDDGEIPDPDDAPVDDRENMLEMLRNRK